MGICSYKKKVNNLPDSFTIEVKTPKNNQLNRKLPDNIIIPKYNELNQSPPFCINKHCINKQGQSPILENINKNCINKHITQGENLDQYYYFKYMNNSREH
jgi:hypothetical protein